MCSSDLIHIGLFLLTCISTVLVGVFNSAAEGETTRLFSEILRHPSILLRGAPYCISVMSILFAHEMGHYLTCRAYGISATLPYFIPAPTLVGTMGAFIKIKSPIHNRRALLDVGIAGPIAGFVMAVPILFIGLHYSHFAPLDLSKDYLGLGEPLIFKIAARLMGKVPPAGMDLFLDPIAMAAWFGLFVTAMNLLPVGQLDGGHVSYAILRRLHPVISKGLVILLIPLGIFFWQGWLVWAALLLFIGIYHPMTLDDSEPVARRHVWLGWIGLAMLVLCFTPVPFYFN